MYKRIILLFLMYLTITVWGGDASMEESLSQRKYALQEHEAFYNLTLFSNGKFEYNYTLFRYGREFAEVGSWKKIGDTLLLKDKVKEILAGGRFEAKERRS